MKGCVTTLKMRNCICREPGCEERCRSNTWPIKNVPVYLSVTRSVKSYAKVKCQWLHAHSTKGLSISEAGAWILNTGLQACYFPGQVHLILGSAAKKSRSLSISCDQANSQILLSEKDPALNSFVS